MANGTTYPGRNSLKLSSEAVMQMVEEALQPLMSGIRVTDVSVSYSGMDVSFTTDKPAPDDLEKYEEALDIVSRWNSITKTIDKTAKKPLLVTTPQMEGE